MPYNVYRLIHFLGIFILLIALTAACVHGLRGGTRADNPNRRAIAIAHGSAAFLVLLGGFGMLARLGIVQGGLPTWIYLKLTIWLILTSALALVYRGSPVALTVLIAMPVLAVLAGAIAIYKPF